MEPCIYWFYAAFLLLLRIVICFYNAFWNDETSTIVACQRDIQSIINWAAGDVHPPLYYLMLHGTYKIFGDSAAAYSILSAVPFLIIILFSRFFVAKEFGRGSGYLLLTFWGTMPEATTYLTEVRMYSWGALFVTLALFMAYRLFCYNRRKDWICFTIFVLASAYTHYFALLNVAFICLFLMWYVFARNRKAAVRFLLSSSVIILSYLPWLFRFLKQISRVGGGNFWLSGIVTLRQCIQYVFSLGSSNFLLWIWIPSLAAFFIQNRVSFHFDCAKKELMLFPQKGLDQVGNAMELFLACGLFSIVGTVGVGQIFSYLFSPILVQRYLLFSAALAWLLFSVCFGKIAQFGKRKAATRLFPVFMIVVLLAVNIPSVLSAVSSSKTTYRYTTTVQNAILDKYKEGDLIIADAGHMRSMMNYYFSSENKQLTNGRTVWKILEETNADRLWYLSSNNRKDEFEANEIHYELISTGRFGNEVNIYFYLIQR